MDVSNIVSMAKAMGEDGFAEFLDTSGLPEETVVGIKKILNAHKQTNNQNPAPEMELFHTSTNTTSITLAAKSGEVTTEAVEYQLLRGPEGVQLLISAAGDARCESMYGNVSVIMEGLLAAKSPITAQFCSICMASSDIWEWRTAQGVQTFIDSLVMAEGLPETDRGEVVRELKEHVEYYKPPLTDEQNALFRKYASTTA